MSRFNGQLFAGMLSHYSLNINGEFDYCGSYPSWTDDPYKARCYDHPRLARQAQLRYRMDKYTAVVEGTQDQRLYERTASAIEQTCAMLHKERPG